MSFLGKMMVLSIAFLMIASIIPYSVHAQNSAAAKLAERSAPAGSTQGTFALVSYFNSGGTYSDYGWQLISGKGPSLSSNVVYFGEPSLQVSHGAVLFNDLGVVTGGQFVSLQFAASSPKSMSVFSLVSSEGMPLLSIGLVGQNIYAGPSPGHLSLVGSAPSSSAYPTGWAYISANVFNTSSNKQFSWTAQLFVDGSSTYLGNISVPMAFQYNGIEITGPSNGAAAYFTDIVFSSYQIPVLIPGYNPMEGYGQGSGLLVNLLQPFTILHAQIELANWNTPETGVLSFQINAMNYYGTTRSTCKGFFQLGVDLNPDGYIAPWYVPGTNCIAHYFLSSNNPSIQNGFQTPANSLLQLSIIDSPANKTITFQITDMSMSQSSGYRYWNATVPYSGTAFYGTYTQLEFQPSSLFPIGEYHFNGTMSSISYGNSLTGLSQLSQNYMLPYTLNAPVGWSFTYYNDHTAGYTQIA